MYGFGAAFLPAVMSGASIDLQEKTNLLKYLDREKPFRPTIAFATPSICEMLLRGYKTPRSNYKVFVTSGQRIGEDLFRNFDSMVSGRLVNQYGSTELGATAGCLPGEALDLRATTIGKPMPDVQLRLDPLPADDWLDGETGIRKGELHCNHPCGFEGYLDEDGEWISKAPRDDWYRTGDVGMMRSDGSIVIVGRAAAGVNRRGYLVLLSDIERRMEKLPALSEVVVVAGAGENKQGQRIAAFCVLRQGADLDGTQVRRQCFDLLPHHAVPDEVHVVTSGLPLLPSGKVDRRSLVALIDR
jgi:acyl-coenzyme A synthetase/AMP-(fatty) acid ligase